MYWACILVLLGGAAAYDHTRYQGYHLLETTPKTQRQVDFLREFDAQYFVDFWTEPAVGRKTEIFVQPEVFGHLKSALYANGLTFHLSDRDISAELKEEWERLESRSKAYDINDYNNFDDIMDEITRLAGICGDTGLSCSTTVYGSSVEGLDLRQITVSSGNAAQTIVFDSLIHAREWLAGATVMNLLDMMITGYGSDADVTRLLDYADFIFIPVMNPDGYKYTWDDERMWRKNRFDNPGSGCMGVDLNRNYAYGWGEQGSSGSECSDTYRGADAGDQKETVDTVNFITGLSRVPISLVSYHTHGYYFLQPYGDCTNPPDVADVTLVNAAACDAIEGTFGENWLCGNSCEALYETSGTSVDWATGGANIKYAYTPELRNDGYGFTPPASSIPLSVEQMWNGMVVMVDEIAGIEG